jgi:hypothetical protein
MKANTLTPSRLILGLALGSSASHATPYTAADGPPAAGVLAGTSTCQFSLRWESSDPNALVTVHGTSDFGAPWNTLTNVPGSQGGVTIVTAVDQHFFKITISNYWGTFENGSPVARTPKPITLAWDYPDTPTSDMRFRLYHSTNVQAALPTWKVITNVAGSVRTLTVALPPGEHGFSLTASNHLGESDFSNVALTPPLPLETPLHLQRD